MEGPGAPLRWWQTRWFVVAATLVALVPLIWPTIPPLVDLPGHMGRYRVQLSLDSAPWLSQWYDFRWSLIGNLGIDLLIIPFAKVFGLELGVKLIVMAIPALTVAGLLWIAREVHGRIPPTALFALPLAYCYPFQFGFANFALSMALALNLFALWLRLGRQRRFTLRAALFVPLSCLLWLCHTFGWGVLGVLAFSAEMVREHDRRKDAGSGHWVASWFRAGLHCAPLALPMLLMVFWRTGDHVTGQTTDWFNWQAKVAWMLMVVRDRWQWWDIAAMATFYAIILKALHDPAIGYSRNLGLSALFLTAVYLLLPRIVFGSAYADMRLAPFVIAIAIIAIRPRANMTARHATVLAALGLVFFLARIGGTTISYWMFARDYRTELAALDHVPVGARLVSFVGYGCDNKWKMSRLEHLPALALERRLAYTNDQWSMAGAQLLTARYFAAGGFAHDSSQIVTDRWCMREWWRPIGFSIARFPRGAFDYVWQIRTPPYDPRYASDLVPIWRSPDGTSTLFKVDHTRPVPQIEDSELIPPLLLELRDRIRRRRAAEAEARARAEATPS
ncbi:MULTISPECIES: hypothetical protein [unclassified Sphingomonas]|uniref:hypothetical protein n=1 Tax=unclassified Sphingomonas TaxID=196159 RepID=UPI000927C379|nr:MULTISPECIES: hypothetical protein [unclassified Sphingomonas]MBN8847401.1 hypothetical protein [Sphingomonas sp.]OJV32321.1 MAG: hypothetical protein BGO24_16240 [Sphingomonas sp. 67-36]